LGRKYWGTQLNKAKVVKEKLTFFKKFHGKVIGCPEGGLGGRKGVRCFGGEILSKKGKVGQNWRNELHAKS